MVQPLADSDVEGEPAPVAPPNQGDLEHAAPSQRTTPHGTCRMAAAAIAAPFTEEHRSTLDWLNRITDARAFRG